MVLSNIVAPAPCDENIHLEPGVQIAPGEDITTFTSPRKPMNNNFFGSKDDTKQADKIRECDDLHATFIKSEMFLIPRRYTVNKVIGRGSYGLVCSGRDNKQKEPVAIKKNRAIFPADTANSPSTRPLMTQKRILRELKILMFLDHPNIIKLRDVVKPKTLHAMQDVYFITDLMEADLRDLILTQQKLSDRHVQFLLFQLLSALNYTHAANILHRDLKPENILINSDCKLKLCDFGLARGLDFALRPSEFSKDDMMVEVGEMSTNYVQTRWYRAPELLLNNRYVSKQCDIWSVGCIFAELLGSEVLFRGSSPIEQIKRILKVLGTPNVSDIRGSANGIEFVKQLRRYEGIRGFSEIIPGANPLALDLLSKMLAFNFEKRISSSDALKHPYFAELYDPNGMILPPSKFDFAFERILVNSDAIKKECYKSILGFHGISQEEQTAAGTSPGSAFISTPPTDQAGISPLPKQRPPSRSRSMKKLQQPNTTGITVRENDPSSSSTRSKGTVKMKLVAKIHSLFGRWKPK
jgi:serine/threonine protein kinase